MTAWMRDNRLLLAILGLALALRLGYGLVQDHAAAWASGGDSGWYLENGYTLVTGRDPTHRVNLSELPTAPLYLVFIGFWQAVLPSTGAIIAIRIAQAIMSALTCFFAWGIAQALTGDRRAGPVVGAALAISPVFIVEAAQVLTETLYIFWVVGGLWVYVVHGVPASRRGRPAWAALALTGLVLGLGTLTRAVLLLYPLGLGLHWLLLHGWRKGRAGAALLLTVYACTVLTWTAYNLARWHRLIIGAEGLTAGVYVGAAGWQSPEDFDDQLAETVPEISQKDPYMNDRRTAYVKGAFRVITEDLPGYLRRRGGELAKAYLQPHGTVAFSGDSLKDMAQDWIKDDRSARGLFDLLREKTFWPKLALYLFHFAGLAGGIAGLWLYRRAWQVALPLSGFILYTALIHLVMPALPRYIFPTEAFWWLFAVGAWTAWMAQRQAGHHPTVDQPLSAARLSGSINGSTNQGKA